MLLQNVTPVCGICFNKRIHISLRVEEGVVVCVKNNSPCTYLFSRVNTLLNSQVGDFLDSLIKAERNNIKESAVRCAVIGQLYRLVFSGNFVNSLFLVKSAAVTENTACGKLKIAVENVNNLFRFKAFRKGSKASDGNEKTGDISVFAAEFKLVGAVLGDFLYNLRGNVLAESLFNAQLCGSCTVIMKCNKYMPITADISTAERLSQL